VVYFVYIYLYYTVGTLKDLINSIVLLIFLRENKENELIIFSI
jgi:hypothetical protein